MYRVVPVRFGYGSCMGRFERFRFSVSTVAGPVSVPEKKAPTVPVPLSVPGKNGSDGSGFQFRFDSWAILCVYIYIHIYIHI